MRLMLLLSLFLPLLISLGGCGPSLSYQFRSAEERSCFQPCRVEFRLCARDCEMPTRRSRSALGVALMLIGESACVGICRRVAARCAGDCRAVGTSGRRAVEASRGDARQRELHVKLMKAESKWPELKRRCEALDRKLRASFAKANPGRESHCPFPAVVLRACTRLTPKAVKCLAEKPTSEVAREACRTIVGAQDELAVSALVGAIADCSTAKRKVQPSSATAVQQRSDTEDPPG